MAGEAEAAERKLVLAHQALQRTSGLQLDFKGELPPAPPPSWLMKALQHLADFLLAMAPIMKFVFWGGLIVAAGFIVWLVAREVMGLRRKTAAATPVMDWRPDVETARHLLADADSLAAAGKFDEAIHLLLFRSIGDLSQRRPGAVKPSLTSRDIARIEAMPATPRDAFARIAAAAEQAVFAGRPMRDVDFRQCRRDYEAFAFPDGWR